MYMSQKRVDFLQFLNFWVCSILDDQLLIEKGLITPLSFLIVTSLMAFPLQNWKRPPGRPRIMWLNTVQRDLRAYNLTLNEAVNLAQNRPLWRLISTHF